MDTQKIQKELDEIKHSFIAIKTDLQLQGYERQHQIGKIRNSGSQPKALITFNDPINRNCKLTPHQVLEIKKKFSPNSYGFLKLANEYNVSKAVIRRIIKGHSWKTI